MRRAVIDAVVLAAGEARRFGSQKLLAPYQDGLVLDGALRAAFAAPAREIVVVTGPPAEGAGVAALRYASLCGQESRLRCVVSTRRQAGLSASLAAGVSALAPSAAGVFIFLGDMPDVPEDMSSLLLAAAGPDFGTERSSVLAAAPMRLGKRGHPVLASRAMFPDLLNLRGDVGAGPLLSRTGDRLALVETSDDGVLRDVDVPEDLGRAST